MLCSALCGLGYGKDSYDKYGYDKSGEHRQLHAAATYLRAQDSNQYATTVSQHLCTALHLLIRP